MMRSTNEESPFKFEGYALALRLSSNNRGWTPLHFTAAMKHTELVEILRRHGGHE